MVYLLLSADILFPRNLLDSILDNVHVVYLLVMDNILCDLVGSDGLVKDR